jgi:hypothetical protein
MNGNEMDRLLKVRSQRRLSDIEEAELTVYFASHPEARPNWEEEVLLDSLLRKLPEASCSSNFTAQVLAQLDLANVQSKRSPFRWNWPWLRNSWNLRWTIASVSLCVAAIFAFRVRENLSRQELAQSTATISSIVSLPSLEVLKNFEAIQRLEQIPQQEVDDELLAALE